jgi:hypothetical protein
MTEATKAAPLLTALEQGAMQFPPAFRALSSQMTQTQFMKLAAAYLGTKAIHSSTIGGFRTGKLIEPAPKTLLALGYFNTALARSIGHPEELIEQVPDIGYPPLLPHYLKEHWEYTIPMLDSNGIAMGPVGMFEAFCGLRELPARERRELDEADAPAACRTLGAFLRAHYGKHNIDWYEKLPELVYDCPTIEPLLLNRPVPADRLVHDLDAIGRLVGLSGSALWEHLQANLGR